MFAGCMVAVLATELATQACPVGSVELDADYRQRSALQDVVRAADRTPSFRSCAEDLGPWDVEESMGGSVAGSPATDAAQRPSRSSTGAREPDLAAPPSGTRGRGRDRGSG